MLIFIFQKKKKGITGTCTLLIHVSTDNTKNIWPIYYSQSPEYDKTNGARGVAVNQAAKVLREDTVDCDIIKIGNLVRNKKRFVDLMLALPRYLNKCMTFSFSTNFFWN